MVRFIFVTFAILAWAFYEFSGGADFVPGQARTADAGTDPLKASSLADVPARQQPAGPEVTRVSLNLTSVEDVLNGPSEPPQIDERPDAEAPSQAGRGATIATSDDQGEPDILPSLVTNAEPESVLAEEDGSASVPTGASTDIREVTGNRVNVRGGPGTRFGVVTQMVAGDEVEVLEDNASGWIRIRPVEGGEAGWIADFLLSERL